MACATSWKPRLAGGVNRLTTTCPIKPSTMAGIVGLAQNCAGAGMAFNASLDSPAFLWLQFNYEAGSYEPFPVPAVGQRVTAFGPVR